MFHITEKGIQPCKAHKRACPLNSEHFESIVDAEAYYKESNALFPEIQGELATVFVKNEASESELIANFLSYMQIIDSAGRPSRASDDAVCLIKEIHSGNVPERIPKSLSSYSEMSAGFGVHNAFMKLGYFGRATKEVARDLARNIGKGTVLDPLAGKGYFAKALRDAGVKTIATDDYSWKEQHTFEKLDAIDSLKKYGDRISHLLISWAPYESTIDLELLRLKRDRFPHITIINVGEQSGGCTGSEEFWEEFTINEPDYPVNYRTTAGLNDILVFGK